MLTMFRDFANDKFYLQALRRLMKPTVDWGPALVKHRKLIDYVPGFVVDPKERDIELTNLHKNGVNSF